MNNKTWAKRLRKCFDAIPENAMVLFDFIGAELLVVPYDEYLAQDNHYSFDMDKVHHVDVAGMFSSVEGITENV